MQVIECKTGCKCKWGGYIAVIHADRAIPMQPHFLRWKDAQIEVAKAVNKEKAHGAGR